MSEEQRQKERDYLYDLTVKAIGSLIADVIRWGVLTAVVIVVARWMGVDL